MLKIGIQKTGPFRKNVCRLPIGVNKIRISSFPVGIISVARLIDNPIIENAIKNIGDRLWVNYIKDGNGKRPEEYKNIREFVGSFTKFYNSVELVEVK